ncbi:D-alanine-D-alanine ligase [Microbacterium halimionae]|uniref:D-alanine--D-alanine ligase n=1 Tax=Microbacterium halimionae TaxID=1526413 RepID=A0A7W3PMQ4_9MICO|nr:D-alanine-D-alanine ligase [Microbacterium halimionae]NII96072.1 D-alanine-D-alanine ligase [Microbacterium halimionae]
MLKAIDRDRFRVIPIGITREGAFVLEEDDFQKFALIPENMPEVADNGTRVLWPEAAGKRTLRVRRADGEIIDLGAVDVVLPILHGPHGEDGTIQGFFDTLDIPYAGGGVLDSAVCMDKHFMKIVLAAAGVPVAPSITIRQEEWAGDLGELVARTAHLTLPWFIKPARAGSSVGVSKVHTIDELPAALEVAFREDEKVLIEQGVRGREIEVGVLEGRSGGEAKVSLPGEIVLTTREFYDFEGKYLGGEGVEVVCPADMTDADTASVKDLARRAFAAVDGIGLARVDFFLTADGPVVNELNTMPGFTPISMFPKCWEASGLSYADLVSELIETALERIA